MPSQLLIRDPTAYNTDQPRNTSTEAGLLGGDDTASVSTVFVQPEGSSRKDVRSATAAALLLHDITASPRLYGYCVCSISSIVSMISSSIFYTNGAVQLPTMDTINTTATDYGITLDTEQQELTSIWVGALNEQRMKYFYGMQGNVVQYWKARGAIAISGLMALITLLVVIAHFDSYFFPKKFRTFFADGSMKERNLLLVLICIAICALQINTSRYSVGEAQANVFFSTWTSFLACVFNYELWRTNAGRHLTFQNVLFDSNFPTKRFWMLLAIFSTITLLAFFEHTIHNNFMGLTGDDQKLMNCTVISAGNRWMWMNVTACLLTWGFLFYRNRRSSDACNPKLTWALETAFAGAVVASKGVAISRFTGGVYDKVPCPSNLYFGLWGTFVVAVWILSSLLQNYHIYWNAKEEVESAPDRVRRTEE